MDEREEPYDLPKSHFMTISNFFFSILLKSLTIIGNYLLISFKE